MLKLIENAVKVSPAVLGVSLLIAGSTHATQTPTAAIPLEQTAVASFGNVNVGVKPVVEPLTELPQPTVEESTIDPQKSVSEETAVLVKPTVELLSELPQSTVEKSSVSQLIPSDASSSLNQTDSALPQQVPAVGNSMANSAEVLEQINRYTKESNTNSLNQVTNVNQLSDVSPGDWAYEALRSLVERYGCIAGYPDGTFRGNRSMSRYEFAAGLNACLQQVERLIASSTSEFVTKNDLGTLQRLMDEFKTELTTLGARVDKLEGRVAFLEDHQFSTTTKLSGEAIFAISDLFGNQDANGNNYAATETVFQHRVRLSFETSFTGKDLLETRLTAANVAEFGPLTDSTTPGSNITREGRFGFEEDTNNNIIVDKLWYQFPLGNLATISLFAAGGEYDEFVPLLSDDLESSGSGSISRFGRFSPIYRMGSDGAGVGVAIGADSPIRLDVGYLTDEAPDPSEGAGLFDGNYSALAQVTFQPSEAFAIAATYVHAYDSSTLDHGTGSLASQIETGRPVVGNSYGIEASYAFTPRFILSGWGGYTNATVIGTGNADVWHYGATLALKDVGKPGSLLGFVVGMEPKLTGSDATVGALLPGGRRKDPDTGLHVEGFYRYAVTDNIAITPGIIWLTAPGHNEANDDIVIGTIRTTFSF